MSRSRYAILPLLTLLLALGACGDTGSGSGSSGGAVGQGAATIPAAQAPGDLASLVPANADMLLYIPSVDALQAKVRRVVGAVDADAVEEVDVDMMLGQLAGPLLDLLDRTKPMAVAAVMSAGGEPAPIVILPVQDVEAAKAKFTEGGMPAPTTKGMYVAMAMDPQNPAGDGSSAPEIALNLPAGDIAIRVNLAKLRETFREEIEEGLKQMDRGFAEAGSDMPFDMSGLMDTMKGAIRDFIDSAESLDLSITMDATTVDLAVLFQAKAGSKLDGQKGPSGNLAAMAKALPAAGVSVLLSMDFGEVIGALEGLMEMGLEAYPEDMREGMRMMWEKAKPLYGHLGNEHAVAFDISKDGMKFVAVSAAKDADAYLKGSAALLDDAMIAEFAKMGIEYSKLEVSKVAGYDVHTMRAAFDMQKLMGVMGQDTGDMPPEAQQAMEKMMARMFGEGGMAIHMANVDGKLVMVMGEGLLEPTLEAMGQGGTPNAALVAAMDAVGGNPTFLLHMDLRALVGGFLDLIRDVVPEDARDEIPNLPAGAPVPLTISATVEGRTYVGRMTLDVKTLMDMIKPLMD